MENCPEATSIQWSALYKSNKQCIFLVGCIIDFNNFKIANIKYSNEVQYLVQQLFIGSKYNMDNMMNNLQIKFRWR